MKVAVSLPAGTTMSEVVIYTIPECKWCNSARNYALEYGYDVIEKDFYAPSVLEWEVLIGYIPTTAPQIFVGGEPIGGCVNFIEWTES